MLTPSRRRGHEFLDDPSIDGATVVRSLHDVARANTLFGGRRAVLRALDAALPALAARGDDATLVDVGSGLGDIPFHARRLAARRGLRLETVGVESGDVKGAVIERAPGTAGRFHGCADTYLYRYWKRSSLPV